MSLIAVLHPCSSRAAQFVLHDGKAPVSIIHSPDTPLTLAAAMLAGDLHKITGSAIHESTDLADCGKVCVVIAERGSPLADAVIQDTGVDLSSLQGQWERYARSGLVSRSDPSRRYLLIAGSDTRGAIWGTVDLSREMGVSAWEWWADVTPRHRARIIVDDSFRLSSPPSVQYRGIFLNDEDWGLQPWAAKTYEPQTGDIGPKTYARIFELMWRLKANLIWPAMHESTKPFYQIPGNAEMARDYAIVVGTSHAEPMMRNNVREWDEGTQGRFDFFINRKAMLHYWEERVEQVKPFENIYTVGLRGKHDSEMEGAATPQIARDALSEVIGLQRNMLAKVQGKAADRIPQALTLYKEVLDLYKLGLKVPDDVTLVWPEDNYGYISQLPDPQEQARSGGSGIYYHISYWGRPHDYLWLATTHPALIREQMDRASQLNAHRLWMLNVGDIKPGEFLTQYFLDMAFDNATSKPPARAYLETWMGEQFDPALAKPLADIMTEYYDLAFERKPEFMGFSGVEPITPIRIGDYMRTGGAEAERRIERYTALVAKAEALTARIAADRQDAYYQLVLYPVRSAANLNERNLKLDLAALRTRQGRPVANSLSREAQAAHARIVADTATYNAQNKGKWNGIMSMAPRDLPVFQKPPFPQASFATGAGCDVDASELQFVQGRPATHALTVYSRGAALDWSLADQQNLSAAARAGKLSAASGYEKRIAMTYDGGGTPGFGTLRCGGKTFAIDGSFTPASDITAPDALAPVELDHTISLISTHPNTPSADWETIDGLGSRDASLRARLTLPSRPDATGVSPLVYRFDTREQGDAQLRIVALPVHALTGANRLRIAVQVDDGPVQVLDFETHGRSEEWKRNVLSDSAERRLPLSRFGKGAHTLKVYALDPGFLLDRIDVLLDGAPDTYGAPPIS